MSSFGGEGGGFSFDLGARAGFSCQSFAAKGSKKDFHCNPWRICRKNEKPIWKIHKCRKGIKQNEPELISSSLLTDPMSNQLIEIILLWRINLLH
jgi:hypothetical protein